MKNLVLVIYFYNERIKYIRNDFVEIFILKSMVLTKIVQENVLARKKISKIHL